MQNNPTCCRGRSLGAHHGDQGSIKHFHVQGRAGARLTFATLEDGYCTAVLEASTSLYQFLAQIFVSHVLQGQGQGQEFNSGGRLDPAQWAGLFGAPAQAGTQPSAPAPLSHSQSSALSRFPPEQQPNIQRVLANNPMLWTPQHLGTSNAQGAPQVP